MIDSQSYMLSFDFSELISQISDVEKSYTEFGKTIKGTASNIKTEIFNLKEQVEEFSSSILHVTDIIDVMYDLHHGHMKQSLTGLDDFSDKTKEIANNIEKISGLDLSSLVKSDKEDKDTVQERVSDVLPGFSVQMGIEVAGETPEAAVEAADVALKKAESAMKVAKKALVETEKSESTLKSMTKNIVDTVKKELERGKQSMVSSIGGMMPGGLGGGLIGGLLGMMILGVKEDVRNEAERGEMVNTFESVTGSLFSREKQKAIEWFSEFQEKAQFYYGIGRKEVQKAVRQFVDAGYEVNQITERFGKGLGEVGKNIPLLTLGLDKHFGVATGTAAQSVNDLVSQYGDVLDEAADKYTRLTFAAQRSGMGVSRFIDSVMAGSQALVQYGIDVEDVVNIMGSLKKHYSDMGLTEQYAGTMAAKGVKGIAGGIAGMTGGFQALIAQRVSPGRNIYETLQKFQEGFARISAGEDEGFLQETIKAISSVSQEMVGSDRAKRIFFLKQKGFGNEAATSIVDAANKFEKGIEIAKLGAGERKKLRDAFKTEGKQMSELQKTQRDLIKGLSKIGEGILKVVTGILSSIITGLKAIPAFINAYLQPTEAKRMQVFGKLSDAMDGQWKALASGFEDMKEGGAFLKDTALQNMIKNISKPLSEAAKMDVGKSKQRNTAQFIGDIMKGAGDVVKVNVREALGEDPDEARKKTRIEGVITKIIAEEFAELFEKAKVKLGFANESVRIGKVRSDVRERRRQEQEREQAIRERQEQAILEMSPMVPPQGSSDLESGEAFPTDIAGEVEPGPIIQAPMLKQQRGQQVRRSRRIQPVQNVKFVIEGSSLIDAINKREALQAPSRQ